MTEENLNYYYFTIQDSDPEARSFGCVAPSLEIAERKARWEGDKSLLLLEARPLEGREIPSVGRQIAQENPLVGADWLPLVDLIASNMSLHRTGSVWSLEIESADDPLGKNRPYAQMMRSPNGGFHLEIGPTDVVREHSSENGELLEMLGWAAPEHKDLPNYSLWFEPPTSFEYIAGTIIEVMTVVFGMSVEDGFFIREGFRKLKPVAGIDMIDPGDRFILCDQLFGLTGRHKISIDALYEVLKRRDDAARGH